MIDQVEIERRTQAILRCAHKLGEFAKMDTDQFVADEHRPVCAERYLQLACEACIEIGLLLISGLHLRRPAGYEDIGGILIEAGLAPADYAPPIERIVKVRSMLVRAYAGVEPRALHNHLSQRIADLEWFVGQAARFARRHE